MMLLKMVEQARELLQESVVFAPGEKVVVAVSGGIDSMVLLDIMDRIRGFFDIELHVAHLDHQLRPESGEDSRFVAAAAGRRGLACHRGCRDVAGCAEQQWLSLEAAARRLRYQFLDAVAEQVGGGKIVLGHHADDQAETVILRLLRGSGSSGLGAMSVVRQGRYLRPLLRFARSELEAYAGEAGIEFREDASNRDLRFVRNRVRHELMPQLRSFNPNIVRVLNRTARVLKEEDQYLAEIAREALATVVEKRSEWECSLDKIILDASRLLDYHIAVQRRVIRTLLQGLSTREGPFDFDQVERALEVARQGDGRLRHLAAGLHAQRVGERFILGRMNVSRVELEVCIPGETQVLERGMELRTRLLPVSCFASLRFELGGSRAAFDAERLGTRLLLRSVCSGDRFRPLGMAGRKKLSDFLIDRKWPRILRNEVLVLTRDEEIAWVVGLHPGHLFRVSSSTRRIALIELVELES